MSEREEMLEVVNEEGQVIGLETRENVHKQGLLHKETHVYFYTPEKELILQHRLFAQQHKNIIQQQKINTEELAKLVVQEKEQC